MNLLDFKFWLSDNACVALDDVGGELFRTACPRLFDGFFVTLELLFLSSILGFALAVLLAMMATSQRTLMASLANGFIYLFRGTPLLVQLWVFYYGLGSFGEAGLGSAVWFLLRDAWAVGLLVLTLNTSAYIGAILRGAINNIDVRTIEEARALGLTWFLTFWFVSLPQAIRSAWPAYGNELILLMKASALVSTITVLDLMGQTRTIFARSYDLSIYLYAAVMYLVLAGFITVAHRLTEAWLRRRSSSGATSS